MYVLWHFYMISCHPATGGRGVSIPPRLSTACRKKRIKGISACNGGQVFSFKWDLAVCLVADVKLLRAYFLTVT